MWEFAQSSPLTALVMLCVAAWAVTRPFRYAWLAYNGTLRSRNIRERGWPTHPNMDADGDLIFPKTCHCDQDEEEDNA